MFVQAAGADRASDVIPLEWYKAELYRLMDMAQGDIPTRVFLATDDPSAEAEITGAFVDGGSLAAILKCEGSEGQVEDCSRACLSSGAHGNSMGGVDVVV